MLTPSLEDGELDSELQVTNCAFLVSSSHHKANQRPTTRCFTRKESSRVSRVGKLGGRKWVETKYISSYIAVYTNIPSLADPRLRESRYHG